MPAGFYFEYSENEVHGRAGGEQEDHQEVKKNFTQDQKINRQNIR